MTLRTTERDKIILNPVSDEEFIPPIFEDLSKLKKQFNFFKWAKDLNRYFTKEDKWVANKHKKICWASLFNWGNEN